ncbi:related to quinic acid utilisation protein QUTG (inositol-1(or 4)-monophosphatase) [Cephalotrichum gorgonifer]|uniref:Inositol-1-monophosphatase n=1 Tax=Cephalotrichum gorgonifer TaxID=2041049 RepID=A0AAE8MTE9_9PEZI|nr:related to quinic acid utilisation protein QUTG (inositol-1(or 4)-monophosphatase) [Cephalotrichum gorgonifer]
MADLDLKAIRDTLVQLARRAGGMIMDSNYNQNFATDTKLNSVDIVTETDKAVEEMISTSLREAYPTFSFMGEETWKPGVKIGPEPTFVVDPIDGTTNFIHGFPHACVSLGLAVDRVPTVGVIYNPFLDILYSGIKGGGATMTTRAGGAAIEKRLPLRRDPAPLSGLGSALLGVEWGSDRQGTNFELKAETYRKLTASKETGGRMVHSLRSLGSAALNLAAVAAGQMDMYWEGGCYAWDVCAGWCILVEAGGIMAGGNPGVWEPELDGRKYLAVRGAPAGQKEIVQEFWDVIGEGKLEYQQ